jgi:hypothetical protein
MYTKKYKGCRKVDFMECIIYVSDNSDVSIYEKYNECARYAKRYGYSIKSKELDFSGNEFYKVIDKVVFDEDVSWLIIYDKESIGDYETALFYQIYLDKFGKNLITVQ